jgi:hypothetical protein
MVFRQPLHSTSTKPSGARPSSTKARAATPKKAVKPATSVRVVGAVQSMPPGGNQPGLVCAATPAMADRVRDVTDLDRTARLVESGQLVVRGFQCGRALPMTGVLDDATLEALSQV